MHLQNTDSQEFEQVLIVAGGVGASFRFPIFRSIPYVSGTDLWNTDTRRCEDTTKQTKGWSGDRNSLDDPVVTAYLIIIQSTQRTSK